MCALSFFTNSDLLLLYFLLQNILYNANYKNDKLYFLYGKLLYLTMPSSSLRVMSLLSLTINLLLPSEEGNSSTPVKVPKVISGKG